MLRCGEEIAGARPRATRTVDEEKDLQTAADHAEAAQLPPNTEEDVPCNMWDAAEDRQGRAEGDEQLDELATALSGADEEPAQSYGLMVKHDPKSGCLTDEIEHANDERFNRRQFSLTRSPREKPTLDAPQTGPQRGGTRQAAELRALAQDQDPQLRAGRHLG
jgi:hypothetical protein